jgi:hypothetical protein
VQEVAVVVVLRQPAALVVLAEVETVELALLPPNRALQARPILVVAVAAVAIAKLVALLQMVAMAVLVWSSSLHLKQLFQPQVPQLLQL